MCLNDHFWDAVALGEYAVPLKKFQQYNYKIRYYYQSWEETSKAFIFLEAVLKLPS